jgi:hypothetical protein
VDVLAHLLDDVFEDRGLPLFGVEIQIPDDLFEARAAQDLLAHRLQPGGQAAGHGRLHVRFGNLLRNDENTRFRTILVRQRLDVGPRRD